jgi:hypothetical protein
VTLLKRTALALTLIMALLYSAVVGTRFVEPAIANPLWGSSAYKGEVDAPSKPTIIISSPKNNTRLKTNSLSVTLNVSIITTNMQNYQEWISRVYYTSDWLQEDTYVYEYRNPDPNYIRPTITEFYYRLNLTEIPEGVHEITFYAVEGGFYCQFLEYYGFSANDSSVVVFTIDTTPPSVSVLSLENRRFNSSDVPLNFEVDEPFEKASYVSDGQQNVTIAGNTTLTGLPNGDHNVTVYAIDEVGNTGVSETIYFSVDVPEPFPTAMVVAVSVAAIALVSVSLLVYFKKRKH